MAQFQPRRKQKKNTNVVIGASTALALALVGGVFYTVTSGSDDAAPPSTAVVEQEQTNAVSNAPAQQQQDAETVTELEQEVQLPEQQEPVQQVEPEQKPQQEVEPVEEKEKSQQANEIDATKYNEGQAPETKPTYVNGILLANKQYPLPASYNPGVDPTAQQAVDEMIAAAKVQNFQLTAFSGFRTYEYQETLYTNYVARDGQAEADRYSARPGHSEHQTGLAFDIGEVGKEDLWLTEAFGETAAGKWLVDNAHQYGFILRYPKGKEHLTGFMYESWHFRYVGKDVAAVIKAQDVTLEEYLGVYNTAAQPEREETVAENKTQQETAQVGSKTEENR